MKESVTKFDLESAFKALDEIDIPVAEKGIRANKPALTEIFSRKSKFDSLFEEYYDIDSTEGLDDAKAAREAEVAKAKLDRIEKIVDLDADSPEDLLTSYVGKYIMQCPQCMTLFYKDKEDIVESEDDPTTVNVNEICQHCGNESGYTLVGKVGEAEAEAPVEPEVAEDENVDLEMPEEEASEEATEEPAEDDLEIDLDAINLDDEPVEEEKTEEAFVAHTGEPLVEDIQDDKELDAKLEAHNEYIEYLRAAIAQEEEALEKATNEQVRVAIQRNIDAFKADLEAALPDAVKNDEAITEEPVEELPAEEPATEEPAIEDAPVETEEAAETEEVVESLTESLHEETDLEVSDDEFEKLINSPEFKRPISDTTVRAMMDADNEADEEKKEVEESLTEGNLLDLGKAIGKKIGQSGKNLKNKISAAIDKLSDDVKTREEKADWILANALQDYSNAEFSNDGSVEANGAKKRFTTFVVIGYTNKDTNGKDITAEPANDKNLVPGMQVPQAKTSYKDADAIAKGWSQRQGNGPASIYLANGVEDGNAVYLCRYFAGKLCADDKLDELFATVASDIAGNASMAQGGMDQSVTSKVKADAVKPGMKIRLQNGTEIEITAVKKITDDFGEEVLRFNATNAEGKKLKPFDKTAAFEFSVMKNTISANESLNTVMQDVEDLDEALLESLISDSLIKTYGNVAGYRLTNCSYINESLNIDGTIYFASGNTRKTTYSFSEAYTENDKVKLIGLNEKLGREKSFALTGIVDNKTFITESFSSK